MAKLLVKSWKPLYANSSLITRLASTEAVKKTPLYEFHVKNGGKMVPFAGYSLPIQYGKEGIPQSHVHTRKHCSIFDVSHMLQTRIYGKDRVQVMESITVADVLGLKDNTGSLTLFTTEKGGIVDDLIVSKTDLDHLYVVSNAGCRHKDMPLMQRAIEKFKTDGKDVSLEFVEDFALIALQGPEMASVLQSVTKLDMSSMPFMASAITSVAGVDNCRVTRCGYTGEDGVEISIPETHVEKVVEALLESKAGNVKLAGLGARDSLRLEVGLCLYGNDIDETTSPIEATLAWTIPKRRRTAADFPGAQIILDQLKNKPTRKRIGLVSQGGPPPRQHCKILDANEQEIGEVTSGCPSPTLGKGINVAIGYVPLAQSKNGTKLKIQIRNKVVEAEVTKMPFVPTNYFSVTK